MRRTGFLVGIAAVVLTMNVRPAVAQFAIAAKAGTTGIGGELSYGIGRRIALRGSGTVIPTMPTLTVSDNAYEIDPPTPLFAVGADFYLTGGLRLFGGLLIGADELDLSTTYDQTAQVGGQTYSGSGTLNVNVKTSSTAPFVGIGFGKTVGSGVGLTFDLGGAILGESKATLTATGPAAQAPESERRAEEQKIQDRVDKYVKVFPMISLGLRIGLGSR